MPKKQGSRTHHGLSSDRGGSKNMEPKEKKSKEVSAKRSEQAKDNRLAKEAAKAAKSGKKR